MADKRISQLIERTDIANNDVLPIVASGATTTNKVTISTLQEWMQDNLDVGVTSVGITLGSSGTDVNVSGSPITTSGNITINIPTASATNRGLLSSADWSTFNGKQNSITLTTSGTSGAATLVGSTLNIPNYTTGMQNSYVPYVGAISNVDVGYNNLAAGTLLINGSSSSFGSYLGFRQSSSVNTGSGGYTSISALGTNELKFSFAQPSAFKEFSFNTQSITAGVAGGRIYTMPDASGTIALTSDLSGYVTLGTAQTITGSKTFNSKIIGQDATLTSSGSTNTLEVFHTSGSGHAVEIQKAGNGEGLRVIKTSGGGNAVTISGGLLSAEAATLTGALNGTSGVFTGSITAGSGIASGVGLNIVNGTNARTIQMGYSTGSGTNYIQVYDGSSFQPLVLNNALTLASTGAATFSNSVGVGISPSVKFQVNDGTNINLGIKVGQTDSTAVMLNAFNDALSANIPLEFRASKFAFQSGNVGIGTASPDDKLHVVSTVSAGTNNYALRLQNTTTSSDSRVGIAFLNNSNTGASGSGATIQTSNNGVDGAGNLLFGTLLNGTNTERMRITSVGNTQPGADNAYSLGVSGTRWSAVWAANGTIQTSDEREKKDIVDSDLGLDFVNQLRPVSFKWKVGQNVVTSEVVKDEEGNPILDEEGNEKTESVIIPREGKRTHYGLIAQEVEELLDGKDFGGFIHDEETDTKGLRYDQFVPLLIKSIQELNAKIAILESKLK